MRQVRHTQQTSIIPVISILPIEGRKQFKGQRQAGLSLLLLLMKEQFFT